MLLPDPQFSEPGRADVRVLRDRLPIAETAGRRSLMGRENTSGELTPLNLTTQTALNLLEMTKGWMETRINTPINAIGITQRPCNRFAPTFPSSHFGVIPPPSEGDKADRETRFPTANKLTCFYTLLSCAFWMNLV